MVNWEHIAWDCIQTAPEYPQWGRVHNVSGQSAAVHNYLHTKAVLPNIQMDLPVHQFSSCCLLSFCLAKLRRAWSIFFALSFHLLIDIDKISSQLSLLQVKHDHFPKFFLTKKMLKSPHHLCRPLLDLLQELHVSLLLRSPKADTELPMWPH